MAFELTKARLEARRAKKEAIIAIDKYINTLSASLPAVEENSKRQEIIDTITKLVAVKEVYKKCTELPKWASEAISTALKILTLVAGTVACEIVTNRGTGDKIVTDAFKRVPGL